MRLFVTLTRPNNTINYQTLHALCQGYRSLYPWQGAYKVYIHNPNHRRKLVMYKYQVINSPSPDSQRLVSNYNATFSHTP